MGLVTFSFSHFSILMFCMSLRTNLNALIHLSIGMICDKVLVFKFSTVTYPLNKYLINVFDVSATIISA